MDPGQSRSIEAAVTTSSLWFRKTQIPRPHHQWQILALRLYLNPLFHGSFDCLLVGSFILRVSIHVCFCFGSLLIKPLFLVCWVSWLCRFYFCSLYNLFPPVAIPPDIDIACYVGSMPFVCWPSTSDSVGYKPSGDPPVELHEPLENPWFL